MHCRAKLFHFCVHIVKICVRWRKMIKRERERVDMERGNGRMRGSMQCNAMPCTNQPFTSILQYSELAENWKSECKKWKRQNKKSGVKTILESKWSAVKGNFFVINGINKTISGIHSIIAILKLIAKSWESEKKVFPLLLLYYKLNFSTQPNEIKKKQQPERYEMKWQKVNR